MRDQHVMEVVEPVIPPMGQWRGPRRTLVQAREELKLQIKRKKSIRPEKLCDLEGLNRILFGKGMR